ncbi:MAG: DUF3619 family protein [Rhodocyclaceae bacterium]|nr:MAG: DUF3619 family protein [Rhodocyclaceae bacterium]
MNSLIEQQQEQRLAVLVRQSLDAACRELPEEISNRLKAASQFALEHQTVQTGGLHLAGLRVSSSYGIGLQLRSALMVLALVAGMAGTYYWNTIQKTEDYADIDTALLADDLPVDAYTDQGFRTWLEDNSAASDN